MISAVLFDLDDTLYRELDYVEQGFRNVAGVLAEHLSKMGAGRKAPGPDMLCYQMMELMEMEGRGKIFDRICERYDADISVQELIEVYRDTKPKLSLYPDGEKLLEWLRDKKKKTGLLTDGNAQVQHRKIEALGLDKRFDVVLASDDLGLAKPDPAVYAYCIDRLGIAPQETVYIGDNTSKDFIGAGKIGMRTIRIIRPEGMYMRREAEDGFDADVTVHLLTEVAAWIQDAEE